MSVEPKCCALWFLVLFRWTVKLSLGSLGVVFDLATDRRKRRFVGVT
jgi:hypothetical protein